MLQKLLIALCTIFVLSACGGDLDLGPQNPPTPDTDNGGGDGDGDGGDFEPTEPQRWLYQTFSEEGSADTWQHRCAEGCNATASLNLNTEQEVLAITPEWASEEDWLEIYTPINEIADMAGANANIWVYVTEDYVNDGHLRMRLFFENAAGGSAYTRPYQPTQVGWNQMAIWEMQAGTGEPTTDGDGEEVIDYGSFAQHSEGFTLTDINTVGVQFSANGKPVEVAGDLWLDNLLLTPSSGSAPLLLNITEGWFSKGAYNIEGDEANDPVYAEGHVSLAVTNPNQQLVYPVPGPVNLRGADVVFTLSIDQQYIDTADGYQPFGQIFDDTDPDGYADDEEVPDAGQWGCWTGLSGVVADEEFEVTCSMPDSDLFEVDENQYALIGVQSQTEGVEGTLRIHRVEIRGASGPDTGPFEIVPTAENIGSWDNDNYQSLEGAADLSYNAEEGALNIVPNWQATDSDERAVIYLAGEDELPDLEGATVGVELYLSDYYITTNPGMEIQIYIQQNGGDYAGNYGGYLTLDSGEDLGDGWYRFERSMSGVPTEPTAQRIGIKLQRRNGWNSAAEAGDDILLRKITVE